MNHSHKRRQSNKPRLDGFSGDCFFNETEFGTKQFHSMSFADSSFEHRNDMEALSELDIFKVSLWQYCIRNTWISNKFSLIKVERDWGGRRRPGWAQWGRRVGGHVFQAVVWGVYGRHQLATGAEASGRAGEPTRRPKRLYRSIQKHGRGQQQQCSVIGVFRGRLLATSGMNLKFSFFLLFLFCC